MGNLDRERDMIIRHIAECEEHIVQQEMIITRLIQKGLSTAQAESFLPFFHECLRQHREHLYQLDQLRDS